MDPFSASTELLQEGATVLHERYTLKRSLGRGGMGIVWLATDNELNLERALKFVPDLVREDPEELENLKREACRSQELTHKHIVRIYDFVRDDRLAAIAMEYIDGPTMKASRLEQPKACYDMETIFSYASQLCDALTYAHSEQIVHHDLKPLNLMINSRNELKVTDFGIAQAVSETVSRASLQVGIASGTPAYMSPEQVMGEASRITDDIYSLGATLFDLLCSKPPFYRGDILAQLLHKAPPRASEMRETLGIFGKEPIPAHWEETIAACLEKDPANRPQTVLEVANRLGLAVPTSTTMPLTHTTEPAEHTPSLPVSAPMIAKTSLTAPMAHDEIEISGHVIPQPAPKTTPIGLIATLGIFAGVLLFGLGILYLVGLKSGTPERAKTAYERGDFATAIRIAERVREADPQNHEMSFLAAKAAKELEYFPQALIHYEYILENAPENLDALRQKADLHKQLRQHEEARDLFRQLSLLDSNPTSDQIEVVKMSILMKDYPTAEKVISQTIETAPKEERFRAHATRARLLMRMKKPNEALEEGRKAIALNPEAPEAKEALGMALKQTGNAKEAQKYLSTPRNRRKNVLGRPNTRRLQKSKEAIK